eukprot:m.11067 g.11067  ORF g.11067 m.11067 type:complete len:206 (-) comp7561_c0_seq1:330-947(-)
MHQHINDSKMMSKSSTSSAAINHGMECLNLAQVEAAHTLLHTRAPKYIQTSRHKHYIHFIHTPHHNTTLHHQIKGSTAIVQLFEKWWRVHDDFMSCISFSASYKQLLGIRPTRSPGPETDVIVPPPMASSLSSSPHDVRQPLPAKGSFLQSKGFAEIQQLIDAKITGEPADSPTPEGTPDQEEKEAEEKRKATGKKKAAAKETPK